MFKKKKRSRASRSSKTDFWIDVADLFILIGEGIVWLFRALFRIFD